MQSTGRLGLAAAVALALLCANLPARAEAITEPLGPYSTYFEFDAVSGYRKVIDFDHPASDTSLYVKGEALVFYSSTSAGATGQFENILLARSNRGEAI